jgi:hypothetical protein
VGVLDRKRGALGVITRPPGDIRLEKFMLKI